MASVLTPRGFGASGPSRDFYQKVFDGKVAIERDPVIMKIANSWLTHRTEGSRAGDRAYIRDPDGHPIEVGQITGQR